MFFRLVIWMEVFLSVFVNVFGEFLIRIILIWVLVLMSKWIFCVVVVVLLIVRYCLLFKFIKVGK